MVLSAEQNAALNEDIATHNRMREEMAPHTRDVLALEFDISLGAILNMEGSGFVPKGKCRISADIYEQVKARRAIYWSIREPYVAQYNIQALMARYGISRSSLVKRIVRSREERFQDRRMAA